MSVAVVTGEGTVQLTKNVMNCSEPFLRLIGDLPRARRSRLRRRSALRESARSCRAPRT
jgi:hypothetical protein